jgi:type I restriction enzyme S subunit
MPSEVPQGWAPIRLGDVSRSFAGGTPSRSNPVYYGPGIPWLKSGEVRAGRIETTEEQITELGLRESSARVVRAGTPVLAMYGGGTVGTAGILSIDAAVNQAVLAIEPDVTRLHNEFCYYLLYSANQRLLSLIQGSGQANLSKTIVDALEVVLPPLDEQKRIAKVLGSVDKAILATEAVIRQGETLWHGLTEALIWNLEAKRPDSIRPLGEALQGSDYGVNVPLTTEANGHPVLRMGNIQDGRIDLSDLKWGEVAPHEADALALSKGDILFNRTNSRDLVGKVALVREPTDCLYASYIVRLSVDRAKTDPYYIFAVMHSERAQNAFKAIATPGASQSNINPTNLKKQPIPLPELKVQRVIAEQLRSVEDARLSAQREFEILQVLKRELAENLLSGRVRVPA